MPANYSKNIVYLSKAQYQELLTNQTITVNGTTVTYNENDIYVTPQAEPITDVKINGTSIGSNGVANIPIASNNNFGVIKTDPNYGLGISSSLNNNIVISAAPAGVIQMGNDLFRPIVSDRQHLAVFYGLSKAAGVDIRAFSTVGTYPDSSKAAIQNMLGITDLLSTEESSTATAAHALNSTFMMDGKLHRATAAIAIGDAVEVGTNCEIVKADEVFVKKTDYADLGKPGIVQVYNAYGIYKSGGFPTTLQIAAANSLEIQAGTNQYKPIIPRTQNESVFYGLSKVAGVDLANETVTLGTYPETSKTAIRSLIGATSSNVIAVQDEQPTDTDTKVWLPETEAQGIQVPTYEEFQALDSSVVKKTDHATTSSYGIVKINTSYGIGLVQDQLAIDQATSSSIKTGTDGLHPLAPAKQHESVFYGLAKAAGDTTQSQSNNAVGTYTDDAKAAIQTMLGVPGDVQVNGTSVVSNGIANIPYATNSTLGVVQGSGSNGIKVNANGILSIDGVTSAMVKTGTDSGHPITANHGYEIAFYGLAKAAGDTTQASSSNDVGTYTDSAKTAIHTMLSIDPASIAAQVDIPLVETVSGTTPTITGQPNVRYVCGEVSTISITPPASGSVDVIFESGSTATTMTVPSTVKWPAWFDAETLEANTTYEILITDGIYGSVMTWAT